MERNKPLGIIGIDPGTTTAHAILDLEGKLIAAGSAKEISLSELIAKVIHHCYPLIIGTDKAKIPSLVAQFSSKFSGIVAWPKEDLKKEEKRILNPYKGKNNHEQDALAAACFAHKKYSPQLEKIKRFIHEHNLQEKQEQFTKIALKEDLHFALIKELLFYTRSETKEEKKEQSTVLTMKDFVSLYKKVSSLEQDKQRLQQQIESLMHNLKSLKRTNIILEKKSNNFYHKLDQLLSFKEQRIKVHSLELQKERRENSELRQQILRLYSFIEKVPQFQLIKKLDTLSKQEFLHKNTILNISENDFVFLENPSVFSAEIVSFFEEKFISIVTHKPHKVPFSLPLYIIHNFVQEDHYFALADKTRMEISKFIVVEEMIKEYQEERLRKKN